MKIAFLSPKKDFKVFEENIRVTSEEFGRHPPISLAYLAALVRDYGHNPSIVDAANLNLSKEKILMELKRLKPDILGVSIHSIYYVPSCLKLIGYLKDNLGIKVIAGGAGFNLYPDEIMSHKVIDYGIAGSARKSLPEFLERLEKGNGFRGISGLYFRQNAGLFKNKISKMEDNLDSFPFPARDLLRNEIYWQFITERKNFTTMLTSRGCTFHCKFCNEPGGRYEERDVNKVIDEIKECYDRYRIREIDFFDRTFTINRKRVIEICNGVRENKLDIIWSCRSRIDTVNKEMLITMKKAGCFAIFYGIESADAKVLENINKSIPFNRVRSVIKTTKELGIKPLGFFMFGNPGETEGTIKKTIDFALSLDLAYATFTKVIAKPKSYYDQLNIKNTAKDYWRNYILGRCSEKEPIRTWTNIDEEMLIGYIRQAFRRFYFRPKHIFNALLDMKSPEELLRYTKSSLKLLFS